MNKAVSIAPVANIVADPLTSRVPVEIPLPQAPLIRVITQISFPAIVSIGKPDFIAPFQEALRADYPVLRPEQTLQGLVVGFAAQSRTTQTTWRFHDAKDQWRVSLTQNYVAVETSAYLSRADFVARLSKVIDALATHINPRVIDRVGTRYIDRVTGKAIKDLSQLVRPEVVGILATQNTDQIQHAMSETLFSIPPGKAQLLARWGLLPKGGTVDPTTINAIDEPSWILDLDMFCIEQKPFNKTAVVEEVRGYSERIYTFFRWAVTNDFLRLYGGNI